MLRSASVAGLGVRTLCAAASAVKLPGNLHLDRLDVLAEPAAPPSEDPTSFVGKAWVRTLSDPEAMVGEVDLPRSVFGQPVRRDLLHRVIRYQRNKRRQPHKTKTKAEIRGAGQKFRRQKGSGMARVHYKYSPQFRGGYKAHGPVLRSFKTDLPKKVRRAALKSALSAKVYEGKLDVVDEFAVASPRTRQLEEALDAWDFKTVLFVDADETDDNFQLASRNLRWAKLLPRVGLNVLDVVKADHVLLSRAALDDLTSWFLAHDTGVKLAPAEAAGAPSSSADGAAAADAAAASSSADDQDGYSADAFVELEDEFVEDRR